MKSVRAGLYCMLKRIIYFPFPNSKDCHKNNYRLSGCLLRLTSPPRSMTDTPRRWTFVGTMVQISNRTYRHLTCKYKTMRLKVTTLKSKKEQNMYSRFGQKINKLSAWLSVHNSTVDYTTAHGKITFLPSSIRNNLLRSSIAILTNFSYSYKMAKN